MSINVPGIKSGKEIGQKKPYDKYVWVACQRCGLERWVMLIKGTPRSKYCRKCAPLKNPRNGSGKFASNWRGGRHRQSDGYIYLFLEKDSFFYPMANKKGYVLEHRLVVAKSLGRCLHSWELVHHKNHYRDDNLIENLQLISTHSHQQITILENKIRQLELENAKFKKLTTIASRKDSYRLAVVDDGAELPYFIGHKPEEIDRLTKGEVYGLCQVDILKAGYVKEVKE